MKEIHHATKKKRYVEAFNYVMSTMKFRHTWIVDEVIVKQMNVWFCNKDEEPFDATYLHSAIKSEPVYANISSEMTNTTGLFHIKKTVLIQTIHI